MTAQTVQNAARLFEGKKFDFVRKIFDNEFSGALRQVVYYSYVEGLGFVYFRFNFKMTSKGWMLAHFAFRDEAQELIPKNFVDR